jgi:hypothetical protein
MNNGQATVTNNVKGKFRPYLCIIVVTEILNYVQNIYKKCVKSFFFIFFRNMAVESEISGKNNESSQWESPKWNNNNTTLLLL